MQNNGSEVRSCRDNRMKETGCYTNHRGVVISLGYDTQLYRHITSNIPQVGEIIVNVAKIIPAPDPDDRVPGIFPNKDVVKQVQDSTHFRRAQTECEEVLRKKEIVLVVCKGGNHRAPTVADSMKEWGRFIIHATLGRRQSIRPEDIEVLVHACVQSNTTMNFYGQLTRNLKDKTYPTELCVGWQVGDLATGGWDTSNQFPKAGVHVEVQDVSDFWCTVKEKDKECIYHLPITWLVPLAVYRRREE